jgi:long-chain acyl-CoA synthetase
MQNDRPAPWAFLDDYRGSAFQGEWPSLPAMFAISAGRFPDRPCLTVYEPDRISLDYRSSLALVRRVGRHLRSLGVGRGSRVAVTGKNSPEWAVAWLATLEAGATVVPIDYQLAPADIARLLAAGEVSHLFVDEEKAPELEALARDIGVKAVFSLWKGGRDYVYALPDHEESSLPAPQPPRGEDLAAILFTSGTTGLPKGVMLTHDNLVADCYLAQANLPIFPSDVFYALLPLHHSYTMLAVFIEALSTGAEVVFGKRMVISQVLKDLREARITMFLGVPLLFNKILAGIRRGVREKGPAAAVLISSLMAISGLVKRLTGRNPGKFLFGSLLEKASLRTIRICISGGGPLAPSVFRQYNQLGLDFVQGYGLTETSPILTLNPTEAFVVTSVGKLIPRVECRILGADATGVGEIAVRGPMVMRGYYKLPAETAEVLDAEGWLRTGDLGRVDGKGYVYLTGRAKNLIVTEGGKNVYPEEIENRFQLFDEVEQVLVRGYLADEGMRTEGIEALVYPNVERFRSGADIDWAVAEARVASIIEEVNRGLLPYQRISRSSLLREALEMTTTKKVKRHSVG